jgi:hypothetical protein
MFLSVVILGRFTTETHAMALSISADTPPLLTPHPGTQPVTVTEVRPLAIPVLADSYGF